MRTVGDSLRRYRLRAGLTQAEVAGRTGLSVRSLRDLEHGRVRSPRARSVASLSRALGLSELEHDAVPAAPRSGRTGRPDRGPLRIDVLGTLSVRHGDVSVEVRSVMQRCLLGLLAAQPGQVVSRDEIVDVLWGEHPPRTCRKLVHVYIGRIRGLLEPERPANAPCRVLRRRPNGYQLDVDADQLDLAGFDALVDRAAGARAGGDAARALELLTRALRCWRGPALADAGERLRRHPAVVGAGRRRLSAVLAHADLALALGRYALAVEHLRPAVHDEPLHEALTARLMLALAGCGEQAAALALFAALCTRLDEDLGIGPAAELRAAQARVLRQQLRPGR
jgi:DNA-binding SARP family transcriptional activator/DNA-binding XRE family transcriptional regulator